MNEFISTLGGFNEEAKTYLSAYDEGVVKEAIRCLGKTVPNGNQFTYFTKILTYFTKMLYVSVPVKYVCYSTLQ